MLGLFVLREKMRGPRTASATVSDYMAGSNVYGADQKFSPSALLLTGGAVVLVGFGLLTVGTAVVKEKGITIIEGTNIAVTKPLPPPQPKEKKVEPDPAKPQSAVTAPVPRTETPTNSDFIVAASDPEVTQPLTFDPGTRVVGAVEPIKPIDPPKLPDPVMVNVQRDMRYASKFQPDYPSSMVRMELEGKVSLKVLVGTDGRVKQVQILSATEPAFASATERQALNSWRFKPATKDGVPYETWYTTSVIFKLDK